MPKYFCIRTCTWFQPDFDTPRLLEPDGGKTVYELQEGAPAHLFQRVAGAAAAPRGPSVADLVDGSPEAQRALAGEAQEAAPVAELQDPEEAEMQQAPVERAQEPEPEEPELAADAQVELLNKSRKELLELAAKHGLKNAEKLPNKPAIVEALLAAGYQPVS